MAPAPKGRGGGGRGGSGGSIDNQCGDYGAFASDYAKAQIGLMGAFLFFFLVLAYLTSRQSEKRKKNHQAKSILRWYQYGIALFLIIALFIMLIVRYSLIECGILYTYGEDATAIGVATVVVNNVAELFMLGIVLFVIISRIFELAGSTTIRRVFTIVHAVCFAIVCIMWAAYVILYGILTYDVGNTQSSSATLRAYARILQAYVILFLLLTIVAVVGLILALLGLSRKQERKKGIAAWVFVLIICLLGYSLYNAIVVFLSYYDSNYGSLIGSLVGYGFSLLFFFGTFFAIFMIARAPGWDWLDPNGPAATRDAYDFTSGQHVQTAIYPNQTPYDTMQTDANKRSSYASHGMGAPATPAPPYGRTSTAYSGNGVYESQGQTYSGGNWGSGGYAPVHQMPTAYNAPMGAASRDAEHNELTGRR